MVLTNKPCNNKQDKHQKNKQQKTNKANGLVAAYDTGLENGSELFYSGQIKPRLWFSEHAQGRKWMMMWLLV